MDLIVLLPNRFDKIKDITTNSPYAEAWDLFSKIILVTRIREVEDNLKKKGKLVIIDAKYSVYPIPYYSGMKDFIKKSPLVLISLFRLIFLYSNKEIYRYLIRGSDVTGIIVGVILSLIKSPFAFYVIGDPDLVYSSENLNIKHIKILRNFFVISQKYLAKKSTVISYVTRYTLQRKYPPSDKSTNFSFSDVYLPDKYFLETPRNYEKKESSFWKIAFIGSLEQRYKGLHILMQALKTCKMKGIEFKLFVVGDGRYGVEYMKLSQDLGITNEIEFMGYLKERESIINILDRSDIFILPSLTEGLPRALIEAMARGLPCIGTKVGGIPELLVEEDMVNPGNPVELYEKITECLNSPKRLNIMSARNLERAKEFANGRLSLMRREFYQAIRNIKAK